MSRSQRNNKVVLGFDSLTDTITNLAGALILVVVLVAGMTGKVPSNYAPLPPPDNPHEKAVEPLLVELTRIQAAIGESDARMRILESQVAALQKRARSLLEKSKLAPTRSVEKAALPLLLLAAAYLGATPDHTEARATAANRPVRGQATNAQHLVQLLEATIRESDQQLTALESRLLKLRQTMEHLFTAAPPPLDEKIADTSDGATTPVVRIKYRPPKEEFTTRKTLLFICEDNAVSFLDFQPMRKRLAEIGQKGKEAARGPEPFRVDDPGSDYQVGILMRPQDSQTPRPIFLATHKPGRPGETGQQAQRRQSRFRGVLAAHNASEAYLSFCVRPDSYEVFRQVRQLGWEAGYEIGWTPLRSGDPLVFQPGEVGVVEK